MIFFYSNPMSRPSSSCIFGSSGPVEVSERGSYIVEILLCFLKKLAGSRTYPPEPDHIHAQYHPRKALGLIPPGRNSHGKCLRIHSREQHIRKSRFSILSVMFCFPDQKNSLIPLRALVQLDLDLPSVSVDQSLLKKKQND